MNIVSRQPSEAPPPRLSALARLPVFLDLAGRRALIAGGSPAAAWKAELLAAAGADVHIFAADAGEEMFHLVERGAAAGSLTLHARCWDATDLEGAAIAVADCEDDAQAQAFHAAAKAAGVPCNTIDRRGACDFEFGAIVNRSPVVVGVSTNGAAPILAQNIRRRIEILLSPSLSGWAARAQEIRRTVMERLASGAPRRAFWERFCDSALSGAPAPANAAALVGLIEDVVARDIRRGRVTLVGAGPGDAELLTLKAVRALQSAEVILFDDLVSDDVLELARREAKRMMVGKRARGPSCAQADINDLMLKLARQGKHVVRLKSGDPMIFGRAGEEIAALEAAGVRVDVAPGVSTANALAAALGVSLTHRDFAQSVRFVTGHARTGELPADLDWRGLADGRTSLVFYMGGRTGPRIAARLLAEGLAGSTPVLIAWSVSRPEQGHRMTTLDELAREESAAQAGQPTIVCIGAAFAQAARAQAPGALLKSA